MVHGGQPRSGIEELRDARLAREVTDSAPQEGTISPHYAALAVELGARPVLDIGCGTGTFACLLARRGIAVTAVDPAAPWIQRTRSAPGLARAISGDAAVLGCARSALRPGGHLVFETRDPRQQAWPTWDREQSRTRADLPGGGAATPRSHDGGRVQPGPRPP